MNQIHPANTDAVAATIQKAISERTHIVIGGQTEESSLPIIVGLSHLNKIIDYPFDDMTITVQAAE